MCIGSLGSMPKALSLPINKKLTGSDGAVSVIQNFPRDLNSANARDSFLDVPDEPGRGYSRSDHHSAQHHHDALRPRPAKYDRSQRRFRRRRV